MRPVAIIRFADDLRLADHAPIRVALERGFAPLPLYVWAPESDGGWAPGGASRVWLHAALADLDATLRRLGSRLVIRRGDPVRETLAVAAESGAGAVYWHRRYTPAGIATDTALKSAARAAGLAAESFAGDCLHEPGRVLNRAGGPFRVFTPFWRRCSELPVGEPFPEPDALPSPSRWPDSLASDALGLRPDRPWATALAAAWGDPTRAGAERRLARFVSGGEASPAARYEALRDIPAADGASGLSPYLRFGQLSVRETYAAVARLAPGASRDRFLAELGWREFGRHLLFHFPRTTDAPLDPVFEKFPWARDDALFRAWCRGRTGVPIVDAGMRELWTTGRMHNRVRMIAGSFLVKHLLLDWRLGARWFWDTLADADLAQNTLGWQWVAGCGADAAPYFRIFNPVTQGERFDAEGAYVRRHVPELAGVPAKFVHAPWTAPESMRPAGYPEPIVSLGVGRLRALDAYARARGRGA